MTVYMWRSFSLLPEGDTNKPFRRFRVTVPEARKSGKQQRTRTPGREFQGVVPYSGGRENKKGPKGETGNLVIEVVSSRQYGGECIVYDTVRVILIDRACRREGI